MKKKQKMYQEEEATIKENDNVPIEVSISRWYFVSLKFFKKFNIH